MALLRIEDLQVSFKTEQGVFPAVKSVGLSLDPGECLSIVGESGSGKSVTMRAVLGLLDPRVLHQLKGKALFQKEDKEYDLIGEPQYLKALRGSHIAMIFQEPMTALNPTMKCGKQILEVIHAHLHLSKSDSQQKLEALLLEVQLTDTRRMIESYPHELSGGQRQRIMIAMALAANPSLLIADEPTTALDASVQADILSLLNKLRKEKNMGLIFISHDLGVVKQVADRVMVMYRGVKIEEGTVNEIFSNPKHPYTQGLIQCRPSAANRDGVLPVMSDFFALDEQGNFIRKEGFEMKPLKPKVRSKQVLVKVEDLKVSYRSSDLWGYLPFKKEVIAGLNFEVFEGETLGVLGESGSGKSTTGRAIMQLIHYQGVITFRDQVLYPHKASDRKILAKKIQLIYQDPYSALSPKYKIGQAFMEIMDCHGLGANSAEQRKKGIELLEKVGLDASAWEKYPHEFSGGQRQRIAIARALLVEPEFIVCDEAVSALDVSVQAQILNLLKQLQREFNLSYLFITHDLNVVRNIADRVLILDRGKLAELEETERLFNQPQNDYTKKLLGAYSMLE